MNLQFYKEKLENSKQFKQFKKNNPQAYLASAFFTFDLVKNTQESQLDYFNKGKFMTFQLDNEIIMKEQEPMKKANPKNLPDSSLDLAKLPEIVKKQLEKNKVQEKPSKIIAILTCEDNQPIFSLNCITSSMSVIKIKLDDKGSCIRFEKLNLFDFTKKK